MTAEGTGGDRPPDPFSTPVFGPPAGWYPDPFGSGLARYWDGQAWGILAPAPQPARRGSGRRALAVVVAVVLGGVLATAVAAAFLARVRTTGPGDRAVAAPTSALPGALLTDRDLVVGQCLEVPKVLAQPPLFAPRECAEPHNGEVMQAGELPASVGTAATARTTASSTCHRVLYAYTGTENTMLHVVYVYPSATSWTAGDRRYVCIAVDRAGDVTTSLKGSKT